MRVCWHAVCEHLDRLFRVAIRRIWTTREQIHQLHGRCEILVRPSDPFDVVAPSLVKLPEVVVQVATHHVVPPGVGSSGQWRPSSPRWPSGSFFSTQTPARLRYALTAADRAGSPDRNRQWPDRAEQGPIDIAAGIVGLGRRIVECDGLIECCHGLLQHARLGLRQSEIVVPFGISPGPGPPPAADACLLRIARPNKVFPNSDSATTKSGSHWTASWNCAMAASTSP